MVRILPGWLETYHLTLMTIPEALLCFLGGYLSKYELSWLWLVNIGVLGHYITDVLDGELGRYRNTGLIKWGFYMDHVLDFLMIAGVLFGYLFMVPPNDGWLVFLLLAVMGIYFAHSMLYFGATGRFEIAISGVGPTEGRFVFILVNSLMILLGRRYLISGLSLLFVGMLVGVTIGIYKKQKDLWRMDMIQKGGKIGGKL